MEPHTQSNIQIHLIWMSKYRKKILIGPVAIRARELIKQIAIEQNVQIMTGKIASQYVHILIKCEPYHVISKLVQYFKGKTASLLFKEFEGLKKQSRSQGFWAPGYCAMTVGDGINKALIKHYIENQKTY